MLRTLGVALIACLIAAAAPALAAPISSFPSSGPLDGTEKIVATHAGSTVNVTPAQIATYVAGAGGGVSSFNTRTGVVSLLSADVSGALGFSPISAGSPALTGTPTAPTPSPGDATTMLATTAFVDASFAKLASPGLTGTPTAPTPSPGDSTTKIATTAFVASGFVSGASASTTYAPLASAALTGSPTVNGSAIVTTNDSRFGGPSITLQNSNYTFAASDCGRQYQHNSGTTTYTLPANASVAIATGCKIEILSYCGVGNLTVQITSDTLQWLPSGTTGTRILTGCSMVTLTKAFSTGWMITGVGISYNALSVPGWMAKTRPANDGAGPQLRMAA